MDDDKYANLSEDWGELVNGYGAKGRSWAGVKLLSKSIFNVGVFAVTEALPKFTEQMQKAAEDAKKK
jgi:hypothetical protein